MKETSKKRFKIDILINCIAHLKITITARVRETYPSFKITSQINHRHLLAGLILAKGSFFSAQHQPK